MSKTNSAVNKFYAAHVKRILDVSLVILFLLFGGWLLLLLLVLLVKIFLGSPVFFRQERPGKDEKIFKLIKFRTMRDVRDAENNLLPDQQRLTAFGMILRKTSLDELPEIFNILRGEMSFVGPRPLLKEYLPYYYPEERIRATVVPGITGLAQVSGRNLLSWEERFAADREYVEKISFMYDLKIIFKTFFALFRKNEIRVGDANTVINLDVERRAAQEKAAKEPKI